MTEKFIEMLKTIRKQQEPEKTIDEVTSMLKMKPKGGEHNT